MSRKIASMILSLALGTLVACGGSQKTADEPTAVPGESTQTDSPKEESEAEEETEAEAEPTGDDSSEDATAADEDDNSSDLDTGDDGGDDAGGDDDDVIEDEP